jgi:hypothetical protein
MVLVMEAIAMTAEADACLVSLSRFSRQYANAFMCFRIILALASRRPSRESENDLCFDLSRALSLPEVVQVDISL